MASRAVTPTQNTDNPIGSKKAATNSDPTARTWCAVVAARLWLSLCVMQTFDAPDEWYQSVEVAYWFVFGRGELTWEWRAGIRSFVYPAPFALVFWLLQALGLDSPWAVYAAPKIMAGLLCAATDWATYKVAARFLSPGVAVSRAALFLSVTSWYTTFIGLRTLSNAAEMFVVLIALLPRSFDAFLFVAGLGCALRPTFALPMLPLALFRLYSKSPLFAPRWSLGKLVFRVAFWVVTWLLLIASVDYVFYGKWVCTPYRFLHFNVVEGLSSLFGVHPWHWYLPLLPVALGPSCVLLPFISREAAAVREVAHAHKASTTALAVVALSIVVTYSVLPHKEMRFIAPVVPLIHLLAASAWVNTPSAWRRRRAIGIFIAFVGLGLTFFTLGLWQRGPIAAVNYLRAVARENSQSTRRRTSAAAPIARDGRVHVMANCHSTPGYSYLHRSVGDLVLNNCSVELASSGLPGAAAKRLPMEHHFFVYHPLEFADWIYDGIAPPNTAEDNGADGTHQRDYRVHEPSRRDAGLADVDLLEALVERIPPRGRELPDRFIMFDTDAVKLAPFLKRHGFTLERSFTHTPTLPFGLLNATYVEVWRRL